MFTTPALAAAVGARVRGRVERRAGDDVDDARPFGHVGKGGAHTEEGGGEVELDHLVPHLVGDFGEVAHDAILTAAGIVHPDGDFAESLDRSGDEPLDGGAVEHVRGDGEAAGATRLDALDDTGEVALAAGGDDHIGARVGHREGDALTDATATAGNHANVAIQSKVIHHAHGGLLFRAGYGPSVAGATGATPQADATGRRVRRDAGAGWPRARRCPPRSSQRCRAGPSR